MKQQLVNYLKKKDYLNINKIIKAFTKVDRAKFLPEKQQAESYEDKPLPIGHDQTISAPHMVAVMTELLEPKKSDKVLELGTGSGYQAAILAEIVDEVITIERVEQLYRESKKKLKNYENIEVVFEDGRQGYSERGPYDKIIITCAIKEINDSLKKQTKEGGIIVAPLDKGRVQTLYKFKREKSGFQKTSKGQVRFVPLKHGKEKES